MRRGPLRLRFASPVPYALLVSALYLVLLNYRFWRETAAVFWHGGPAGLLFLAALFALLLMAFALALLLIPGSRLMQVASGMLFPIGAMAAYTADSFGLAVDSEMVRSLVETTQGEAGALVGPRLLLYALGLGVLPLFIVGSCRIGPLSLAAHLRHRLLFCAAALALSAPLLGAFAPRLHAFLHSHARLHYLLVPAAALHGAAQFAASGLEGSDDAAGDMAGPAQRLPRPPGSRPLLMFLVVGETARHASFQLGGYDRPTNALLAAIPGVHYFSGVESCGTSTAVSLPCMFSPLGRERFSVARARGLPNALQQLAGAGVRVQWRSNNSGSAGIGASLPMLDFTGLRRPQLCNQESCYDEIMLTGLAGELAQADGDTLVGFHQMGSHGPAYFRRYPPAAERFRPACASNELARCSSEEIRNAYDNTIVYTDFVLASQIALLEGLSARFDTALLYLSDHGESLGENRVFLHGAPYAAAPAEQKRVPLLIWMSEGYRQRMGLDDACLARQAGRRLSHDNLYHTLLGMMATRDRRYDGGMDMLAPCRPDATSDATGSQPGGPPGRRGQPG